MTSSIFREIKLTEEEHGKVIDYVTSEEYLEKARKYIKDIKENFVPLIDRSKNDELFAMLDKKFKRV